MNDTLRPPPPRMPQPRQLDAPLTLRQLRRELLPLLGARYSPPPPHALESEAVVLCGLLEGWVTDADLEGLDPTGREFFADQHRLLFAVLCSLRSVRLEPTDARVLAAVAELGIVAPRLASDLRVLRGEVPTVLHLRPHVDAIIAAARRRRALDAAERAAAALRNSDPDADVVALLVRAADALTEAM